MLEKVALFAGLEASNLADLEKLATIRSFPRHSIIVNEGDDTDCLYVIQSGKVKVYLSDEDGKEVTLTIQGPGDYFGEIALMDEAPRSASVMTLEDTRCYVIARRDFEAFLVRTPEVAIHVIRGLTQRLRKLTENVRSLALMDVYGRIARTLLTLAEEKDGKKFIPQRLTHRDIASMVGSSREMVSRIMKDLTSGGYLTVDKSGITINEKLPARW